MMRPKRNVVCLLDGMEKHPTRNVDEGDLGVPTDRVATEGDLYNSTEGTSTGVHVTGVKEVTAHARVEHLSVTK